MTTDLTWLYAVAALLLGFIFKVVYDELKSPKIRIVTVSKEPFGFVGHINMIEKGFDNSYSAYRIKIANRQRRYLNCAAENCVAWLELDSAPEAYQLSWVGSVAEVTINVGDVREVDICARGTQTGQIIAPTERGYLAPLPRTIGDGTSELQGKLRITCKNGRRAEKTITIKPTSNNQLEIKLGSQPVNRHGILKTIVWMIGREFHQFFLRVRKHKRN